MNPTQTNILTRGVTPHLHPREAAVLVVVNRGGQVLLAQENQSDQLTGRKAGDWNLITETWESQESLKSNVGRAIEEELGEPGEMAKKLYLIRGSYREANFRLDSRAGRARLIVLRWLGEEGKLPFRSKDSAEIADYRWATLDEINGLEKENKLAPSVAAYLRQLRGQHLLGLYRESELLEPIHWRRSPEEPLSRS